VERWRQKSRSYFVVITKSSTLTIVGGEKSFDVRERSEKRDQRRANSERDEEGQSLNARRERRNRKWKTRGKGRKTQETREEESSGGWSKNSFRMALVSPFTADLRRSAALVTHLATKTKRTASQERPLPSVQITLAISLSTSSRSWLSGNFDDAAVPIPPPTRSRRY
ncbi:hypothetical protein K0M31_002997, partial [Melipona bicolor]